jgi:hypothetical protein
MVRKSYRDVFSRQCHRATESFLGESVRVYVKMGELVPCGKPWA